MRNPSDPAGYITPVWTEALLSDFDPEAYAKLLPNAKARVESWGRLAHSDVYLYLCSLRKVSGELTKDFQLYCVNMTEKGQFEPVELTLPEDLEYDTVLPVLVATHTSYNDMGCLIFLKLTNGDEWYYVYFDNFTGFPDGKFLEFEYKGVLDDRFEQKMWYNYHDEFELESQLITITDIADWDSLPWRNDEYSATPRAAGAYSLVYSMVSEDSTIPELKDLGVKDYSLRLLYDLSGQSWLEFKFTVTGNSLPETLPPGDYTWTLDQGMYLSVYDCLIENTQEVYEAYGEKKRGLDKYGDIPEVRALNTFLSWSGSRKWEICDFGEWGDDLRPVSYISAYYGGLNLEISYTEAARLLEEKFGIILEKPGSSCYLDRCDYDSETDTIHYADTRGVSVAHRFLDVRKADGVSYITVQFFADRNYIIPSHKVEYAMGEGDVFLGCRLLDMGNYAPFELDSSYTYSEAEVLPGEPKLKARADSATGDGFYTRFTLVRGGDSIAFDGKSLTQEDASVYTANLTNYKYAEYAVVFVTGRSAGTLTEEVHVFSGTLGAEYEVEDPLDFIEERVTFSVDENGYIIDIDGARYRVDKSTLVSKDGELYTVPTVGNYIKYRVEDDGRIFALVGCSVSDSEICGTIEIEYYFSNVTNSLRAGLAKFYR